MKNSIEQAMLVIVAALLLILIIVQADILARMGEPQPPQIDTAGIAIINTPTHASATAALMAGTDTAQTLVEECKPKDIRKVTATAYCACEVCCGKTDGITATGTQATQGRTIAVDPAYIPLGTHVLIDGKEYIAEDTGGAIGGARIDIFFDNHTDALIFGVQEIEVEIL